MNISMEADVETIRTQVQRVLQSKTFETSEVHRQLFQYLAEKTLSGESDRLKEYTVGLEAFGKPSSYDPRSDSIVRLQIGRVRQKLMAYYQTEAGPDELVITLPKGVFRLNFEPARAAAPTSLPKQRVAWILSGLLAMATVWAVLATFGVVSVRRNAMPSGAQWTPELEALWAPFLHSNRSLLICLGTPLFVRLPNYGLFRDPKTNDWQEVENSARIQGLNKALGSKDMYATYPFTGAGEASAAFLLGKLLATRRPDILLTRSNLLSWQQISDHNVVFLGPPKFNPQLQAAVMTQEIVVEPEGIRNLKPRRGEPEYLPDHLLPERPSEGETHAVISRMQGISGSGEFLIVAGNASPDTLAASEWLSRPGLAKELVDRLRTPSGALPRSYQVVLKVVFKQGIPVQSSYVFHHAVGDAGPASSKR